MKLLSSLLLALLLTSGANDELRQRLERARQQLMEALFYATAEIRAVEVALADNTPTATSTVTPVATATRTATRVPSVPNVSSPTPSRTSTVGPPPWPTPRP